MSSGSLLPAPVPKLAMIVGQAILQFEAQLKYLGMGPEVKGSIKAYFEQTKKVHRKSLDQKCI